MQYGYGTSFQLRGFLLHSKPLKLFCDNSTIVSFSNNTMSIDCSKHTDVKFFFFQEKVAESLISVEHTPMNSMLADLVT